MKWLALLLVFLVNQNIQAKTEVIKFPEEELASESVLPVFDQPEAVKKRNVITAKKFEIGGFGGWTLNDAFFSPLNGGLWMTYHFSEIHAAQLMGAYYMPETSSYAKQLKNEQELNFEIVPQPQYLAMAAYEFTPFYGKMSVTKQFVMNLAIYTTLGAGVVAIGNETSTAFSLGLGQKFYISNRFGVKGDLRALMYESPNPLSKSLYRRVNEYDQSEYQKHFMTNFMASAGFFILL